MNLTKIASNIYSLIIKTNQNPYCGEFQFTLNTNDHRLPAGRMVIDTFSTGQIYMNLPKNKVLSNATENLRTIFTSFYHDPDNYIGFNLARKSSDSIPNWVQQYSKDGFDGWILDVSLFFELETNYSGIAICKNFTGTIQSGKSYQAHDYPFANIPSFAVCSSSKVAINKTVATPCAFAHNQYKCPFYEARYDVLESNSIKTHGSENTETYELRVSPCLAGDAVYQVVQISNNNVSYSINVEIRSDETDTEAKEVFHQVMNTYKDGFTSLTESNNMINSDQKNSYILSLS